MVRDPTASQWQAVRACDEHTLVEAGAGTGKTFTVVRRILYLLGVPTLGERYAAPVSLSDIVAITFTRQAAADLKRDLRSALREVGRRSDAYLVDQARIGTIHGFCSDLVREQTLRSGRVPLSGVLEEGEALAWAEGAVRDELLEALETRAVDGLDLLLGSWDTARVEGWVLKLMRSPAPPAAGEAQHSPQELALLELARRSLRRLERRLDDEGRIDYDRMIVWTRDLLRDEHGVRAMLRRRIHTLIIDEFQDTDQAQREIAYLLADPASGRSDTPRLMLVGDPKQSIYRFRGADVTVWSRVREDFQQRGYGRVLRLTDNFRSLPAILALVERTAGRSLNAPVATGASALADYEVAFHPVHPTRRDEGPGSLEVLVIPPRDDGKARKVEERRAMEAEAVARRMLELNWSGTPWRDMVLLLRTWSNMDTYASAMRRAGIPVYALRDDDFLETREVLDLLLALQAIRDPADDLALVGFLRSPFVSLRDDTLLAIASRGTTPYGPWLRRTLSQVAEEHGAVAGPRGAAVELPERDQLVRSVKLLYDLAALRDRIPAAELLEELLYRTGYMAHLAMRGERGAQAALNVRRFLQMIGSMEADSVGLVLRAMAERRARQDRIPQARLHGEADDVVLITSVHMAKGLDWPVVFYGDLSNTGASDHDKLIFVGNALALGEPDATPADQPSRWRHLCEQRKNEEKAEDRRVTYVALTRPKDRLILVGVPQGSAQFAGSVAEMLLHALPALSTAPDGAMIPIAGSDGEVYDLEVRIVPPIAEQDRADGTAVDAEMHATLPASLSRTAIRPDPLPTSIGLLRHSATELLTFARCRRKHRLKYAFAIPEPRPEGRGGDATISSVARGQIVHDVLERIREDAELEFLLEDAIGRWDEHAPPPDSDSGTRYRDVLAAEIERVLALPEYAALASAPDARRELRFLHVLGEGAAMQGAIDLAAADGDGVALVDVKTSRVDAVAARKKAAEYAIQKDVYVSAASALGPRPVKSFGFIFSGPATGVVSEIGPERARGASARVRSVLPVLQHAPDEKTADPRECYFCGYRVANLCEGVREEPRAEGDQLVLL
jgi:ATP-dependent helicase/nuclease subunit A